MSAFFSRKAQARSQVIRRFVKKLGLVYFGVVDQHHDEHDVVRGLTISASHRDTHYAVGSYQGHDISLVDRSDMIRSRDRATRHQWLIIRISLQTRHRLPHLFFKPNNHSIEYDHQLSTVYTPMQPVNSLLAAEHSSEFHDRYQVYAVPGHAQDIEHLLTRAVSQQLATRFWPHGIELQGRELFIYDTDASVNETRLQLMLESGLWLAETLEGGGQD